MPEAPKYFSESQRASFNKGVAEGMTRNTIETLLKLLSQRGLRVTEDQRRRIRTCTDLAILERWLDRVLVVASVDELLE